MSRSPIIFEATSAASSGLSIAKEYIGSFINHFRTVPGDLRVDGLDSSFVAALEMSLSSASGQNLRLDDKIGAIQLLGNAQSLLLGTGHTELWDTDPLFLEQRVADILVDVQPPPLLLVTADLKCSIPPENLEKVPKSVKKLKTNKPTTHNIK